MWPVGRNKARVYLGHERTPSKSDLPWEHRPRLGSLGGRRLRFRLEKVPGGVLHRRTDAAAGCVGVESVSEQCIILPAFLAGSHMQRWPPSFQSTHVQMNEGPVHGAKAPPPYKPDKQFVEDVSQPSPLALEQIGGRSGAARRLGQNDTR